MSVSYRLVLPPGLWRGVFPQLSRREGLAVVRLARNPQDDVLELIAQATPVDVLSPRGELLGPLDDLLVVRLASRLAGDAAGRLLADFAPLPQQFVVGLVLGFGPAAGAWSGAIAAGQRRLPLAELRLLGPGMRRATSVRVDTVGDPTGDSLGERYSRTRGALGTAVWDRVRGNHVAIIGASRNGSIAATIFAMLGVARLLLIDSDVDELHGLDATLGATPDGIGSLKVHNRRAALTRLRPDDLVVETDARALPHPEVARRLRNVDLICTCVDRDAPRLVVAEIANRWCKVHLDIGTGVFAAGASRVMGADVRLLLPGEACVACLGGLRDVTEARYEANNPPGALRRGPRRAWDEQRAGSLVTLNAVAVNLGVQLWLDLLRGAVTESRWLHTEWDAAGRPTIGTTTTPSETCPICRPVTNRPRRQPA